MASRHHATMRNGLAQSWVASLAALVALLSGAAACGGDDGNAAGSENVGGASATTTAGSASAGTAGDELTDSFRGVTADTIMLGFTAIDYKQLRELGLLDIDRGDPEVVVDAFVSEINERGGINGRQIDYELVTYFPAGAEDAQAACISLTEDDEVFAVIGGFTGPGAAAVNRCVTEAHETILVGNGPRADDFRHARAPWLSPDMSDVRAAEALVTVLERSGRLEELGVLAVHSDAETRSLADEVLVPLLEAAGATVAERTVLDVGGTDVSDAAAQWETFALRYRDAGVESVIVLGNVLFDLDQIIEHDLDVTVYTPDRDTIHSSVDQVSGYELLSAYTIDDPANEPDSGAWDSCTQTFTDQTGIPVAPPDEVPEGEPNWWRGMASVCNQLAVFEQVASTAGANLTNDTFLAAAEGIGRDLVVPGRSELVSFGPGKLDAQDGFALIELQVDDGEITWVPVTQTYDVADGG